MEYDIILPNEQIVTVKLNIQSHQQCRGADLFSGLFANLGLRTEEEKFFGLLYCDKEDGQMDWLERHDTLKNLRKSKVSRFHFSVRYYPEHPELVLHDDKSRKLFRVQIKEKLLKGEWGCDAETHAYLDSLIVQAEVGDYNPRLHKVGYLESIKGVDIWPPSRLNSEKDETVISFLHRVHYHHKRHLGISEKDADILYLNKTRELPRYGFIVHEAVDKNGNNLCVGLREQSIALFAHNSMTHCSPVLIKTEFSWNTLKFCTHVKSKVKIGVTMQKDVITELTWKVKCKNCFKGAERLCNDIKAFRDMYCSRDESDFCTNKKEVKRAQSFARQSSKERPKFRRFNTVTTILRSSLRRKKKTPYKAAYPQEENKSEASGSKHDSSTAGLVVADIQ